MASPYHPRQQTGTSTRTATPESQPTQTITAAPSATLVLRLRGSHDPAVRRRIQWAEDVIDNEGLGRKKSKVCCIYHKTRDFGESSSEDDSDSDSDSGDDGRARRVGGKKGRKGGHGHEHGEGDGCGKEGKRKPSPNAYERMPKYEVKKLEGRPGK